MLPATDENSKGLVNSLIEYSIPGNIPEGLERILNRMDSIIYCLDTMMPFT